MILIMILIFYGFTGLKIFRSALRILLQFKYGYATIAKRNPFRKIKTKQSEAVWF